MNTINVDKVLKIVNNLDSISETLTCIKEAIERTRSVALVEDYFHILAALEQVTEAKVQMGKIIEEQGR